MENKENKYKNSLDELKESFEKVQNLSDLLTDEINKLPKTEQNNDEICDLYTLLEIAKDLSRAVIEQTESQENIDKNLKTIVSKEHEQDNNLTKDTKEKEHVQLNSIPELDKKENIKFYTRQDTIKQLKENCNILISSLKSALNCVKKLVEITKNEVIHLPKNIINNVKNKIDDSKYKKSKNVVLKELDHNIEILSKTLNTIEQANKMLNSLDKREIKPIKKSSILKQLYENKEEVKRQSNEKSKNKETER